MTEFQPRKTPTQERAKKRVSAILAAAERILISDGFDKMSTNRIAREANVSIGSVYQYFPNKESIVVSLCESEWEKNTKGLSAYLSQLEYMELGTVLPHYVAGLFEAHGQNPALFEALRIHAAHIMLPLIRKHSDTIAGLFAAHLKKHVSQVEDERADVVAFVVVTTVNEVLHATYGSSEKRDPKQVAKELTRMLHAYLELGN